MGKPEKPAQYTYPASEGLQLDERALPPPRTLLPTHNADDRVPLVFYSIEGNEVIPKNRGQRIPRKYCGLAPVVFWVVFGIALLVVIGGAIGAGVGVSLGKKKDSEVLELDRAAIQSPPTTSISSTSTTSSTTTASETTNVVTSTSVSAATQTPTCPSTLRLCAFDATCSGRNNPFNQVGMCADGCSCQSTCGAINGLCTTCGGKNDPLTPAKGTCEIGTAMGCFCDSVCGKTTGSCDSSGCVGKGGFCTAGIYWGCKCLVDEIDKEKD